MNIFILGKKIDKIPLSGILLGLVAWSGTYPDSVNHLRPVSHASSSTDANACRDGTVAAASSVERVVEP